MAPHFSDPNVVLAVAMVVGGVLQLALQIPFVLNLRSLLFLNGAGIMKVLQKLEN